MIFFMNNYLFLVCINFITIVTWKYFSNALILWLYQVFEITTNWFSLTSFFHAWSQTMSVQNFHHKCYMNVFINLHEFPHVKMFLNLHEFCKCIKILKISANWFALAWFFSCMITDFEYAKLFLQLLHENVFNPNEFCDYTKFFKIATNLFSLTWFFSCMMTDCECAKFFITSVTWICF